MPSKKAMEIAVLILPGDLSKGSPITIKEITRLRLRAANLIDEGAKELVEAASKACHYSVDEPIDWDSLEKALEPWEENQ